MLVRVGVNYVISGEAEVENVSFFFGFCRKKGSRELNERMEEVV